MVVKLDDGVKVFIILIPVSVVQGCGGTLISSVGIIGDSKQYLVIKLFDTTTYIIIFSLFFLWRLKPHLVIKLMHGKINRMFSGILIKVGLTLFWTKKSTVDFLSFSTHHIATYINYSFGISI